MNADNCAEVLEKNFTFWSKLHEAQRSLLCENTAFVHYGKGDNIHGVAGGCTGGIMIKTGRARAYILSEGGREITLYRLFPGDICMLSASCILQSITFDVFVDAEEDCEALVINPSVFDRLVKENVYVENFALNVVASRFSDVMWTMQQILFMSMDKRLAVFLTDELSRTGGDTVHMTHEQIARYIGSAREVVTRVIKYFVADGVLEATRSDIRVIDRAALRRLTV